jgi:DNA-binding MarR family transcriptional regulator
MTPSRPSSERKNDAHDESLGRLLLRAHRRYADRALALLQARGHPALGTAHVTLLPHIDPEGTRATVLATRAGITKQAVGQLLNDLEKAGYITRTADADDARAARVTFTRRGRKLVEDADAVKTEVDAVFAESVGEQGLARLRSLLVRLLDVEGD